MVLYPFNFVENDCYRKSLERRLQKKVLTAIDGTENTVITDTRKVKHRNFSRDHCFRPRQEAEKVRQKQAVKSRQKTDIASEDWTEIRPIG